MTASSDWEDWQGGLFGLPPGADFVGAFVEGLLDRCAAQPPEAMAGVTIYANTRRTLIDLRNGFHGAAQTRGRTLILPQLHMVTDLGAALPGRAESPLTRQLELGDLIAALIAREPDLAAGQSVPELAASLAELMAEMQYEGCDAQALETLEVGDHAAHWHRALAFLRIAADFYLRDASRDAAARQRAASQKMADDWAAGRNLPEAPIIAIGSTGSHGATHLFLRALAGLRLGAVVLPGYDFTLPDPLWEDLPQDHPQARLAALRAGAPVQHWHSCTVPEHRNQLISLAMRPAPVTDQWISEGPSLGDLTQATAGLTLIEASQPQEEADAIALTIRAALAEDQPVTLFSGDRMLVRRITAALDRWGVTPDDSAGEPLHLSAQGLFLRHIADLFGQPFGMDVLLGLLKHPVTATGGPPRPDGAPYRGLHLLHSRELELHLRAHGPAFPDRDFLRKWGARGNQERADWAEWLADLITQITAIEGDHAARPLSDRLTDLIALAEGFASGPGGDPARALLWNRAAGDQAAAVIAHLQAQPAGQHPMGPGDFADLLAAQLRAQQVRAQSLGHPMLRIFGTREARTATNRGPAGLTILAGLNENAWPAALSADPWLSRPMRAAAGLTPPERLIGLAAHDFQQAIAAPRVVLSRAARDADAQTIPSRWLNRLTNLIAGLPGQNGPEALKAMRDRGAWALTLARQIARPPQRPELAAPRPAPIPPDPAPTALSVTQIRTLIRDPYAIYASKVLGLRPLNPIRPEPSAALRGQILHLIAEALTRLPQDQIPTAETLRTAFLRITEDVLTREVPWPAARAFWQARMVAIADQIARDEAARRSHSRPVIVEERSTLISTDPPFALSAKPDRIDARDDGTAVVYDYKSGKPPTDSQIAAYDKQLLLEAEMVARGSFGPLGPRPVSDIAYIQLGGAGQTELRKFSADMAAQSWDRLRQLIGRYQRGEVGFAARRAMEKSSDISDYDHLSRFGEWGVDDPARPERLTHHD